MSGTISDPRLTLDNLSATQSAFDPFPWEIQGGEEGVTPSTPSAYVPISERDPRKELKSVVEGAKEDGEEAEEKPSFLGSAWAWVGSAFLAICVALGIYRANQRPELSFEPEPLESKDEWLRKKLYNAMHLLDFEPGKRSRLIEAWEKLPDKSKRDVVTDELKGQPLSKEYAPALPPKFFSLKLSAIMDRQAERRFDLTSADGMFAEAEELEREGKAYAEIHMYSKAYDSYTSAARTFESLGAKYQVKAVGAYRSAAMYAEFAGMTVQQSIALNSAERAWIKGGLMAVLESDPSIAEEGVDARKLAEAVAWRADMDESFKEKLVQREPLDPEKKGFTFPTRREGWQKLVGEVKVEVKLGLRNGWRLDLEKFLYENEEPGYRNFQSQGWYAEITKEQVAELAPMVVEALKDPAFRERHLKNGVVSYDGFSEVLDAKKKMLASTKPPQATEPVKAQAEPFDSEEMKKEDRIVSRFENEKKSTKMLFEAFREDREVLTLGRHGDMVPLDYIDGKFTGDELPLKVKEAIDKATPQVKAEDVIAKLMQDKDMRRYLTSISEIERTSFTNELIREWKRVGKGQEVGPWIKSRVNSVTQMEMAEMAREADERSRDKRARRERKDRSRHSIMEKAGKDRGVK